MARYRLVMRILVPALFVVLATALGCSREPKDSPDIELRNEFIVWFLRTEEGAKLVNRTITDLEFGVFEPDTFRTVEASEYFLGILDDDGNRLFSEADLSNLDQINQDVIFKESDFPKSLKLIEALDREMLKSEALGEGIPIYRVSNPTFFGDLVFVQSQVVTGELFHTSRIIYKKTPDGWEIYRPLSSGQGKI